jgi:hypothetical protein
MLLAVALLAAGGCRKKQEAPAAAAPTSVPEPRATAVPGSARVVVEMTDRGVNMDGSVLPGPTTFVISNTGRKAHRLAIERAGEITRLDSAIDPGAEGQLHITLAPGTYRVFCTVSNHSELPRQLVVTARRSY